MAVTIQGSGSQTATIGTEHTLLDVAVVGVFQLYVNLFNMADADYLELRVYKITAASGTRRVAQFEDLADAQVADRLIAYFDPIGSVLTDAGALRFSLKQTAGTGRAYEWEVLKF